MTEVSASVFTGYGPAKRYQVTVLKKADDREVSR